MLRLGDVEVACVAIGARKATSGESDVRRYSRLSRFDGLYNMKIPIIDRPSRRCEISLKIDKILVLFSVNVVMKFYFLGPTEILKAWSFVSSSPQCIKWSIKYPVFILNI